MEARFRARLLAHLNSDHELLGRFDPYAASKLLRYLLTYNDSSEEAIEVYKSLSLLLAQTIADREVAIKNAKLSDPLIDIDSRDIVDILRIYSPFAQGDKQHSEFIPKLFHEEDEQELRIEHSAKPDATLQQMSVELLRRLQGPILKKLEEATIANLSDVLFAYSLAGNDLLSRENYVGHV